MQTTPKRGSESPHDEIFLGDLVLRLLRFYQRFGRLIVLLALLTGVSIASWVASRPLYSVTALLEVPGITLEEWRQTQSFLWDQRWINRSFNNTNEEITPPNLLLQKRTLDPEYWQNILHYRPSLNRDDIRDIPAAQFQNSGGLGLEFTLRVSNEAEASKYLSVLTQHVRETFLANSLTGLIRKNQADLNRRPQLKLDLLKTEFEIEQNQRRIADMRSLLERYPDLRNIETSTLFSVSNGGGKYLSPLPQIVALETTVSELQAKLRMSQRELEKLAAMETLLAGIDQVIRTASSGSDIFDKLHKNRETLLSNHAQPPAMVQEAIEEINLNLAQVVSRQQAIGIKTRSAISTSPIAARNPWGVGFVAFCATFIALSILIAIHVLLRKDRALLHWMPHILRRWLIVELPQ